METLGIYIVKFLLLYATEFKNQMLLSWRKLYVTKTNQNTRGDIKIDENELFLKLSNQHHVASVSPQANTIAWLSLSRW